MYLYLLKPTHKTRTQFQHSKATMVVVINLIKISTSFLLELEPVLVNFGFESQPIEYKRTGSRDIEIKRVNLSYYDAVHTGHDSIIFRFII